MIQLILEIVVAFNIVAGALFAFVGSLGLAKLPDLMTRLHAPTKATTLGVGGALTASVLYFNGIEQRLSIHEALITVFLFLTAPVTAHFIAKAYMHRHLVPDRDLPPAGPGSGWATFDPPPQVQQEEGE